MLAVKCVMMLFLQNAEKDVMIAQMKTQLDESRLAKTSQHSLNHTPAFDDDTTTTGGNDKTSIYTQTETVSRELIFFCVPHCSRCSYSSLDFSSVP